MGRSEDDTDAFLFDWLCADDAIPSVVDSKSSASSPAWKVD